MSKDLIARLREHATDWDGSQMPDLEPAKGDPTAGDLRAAADLIERLTSAPAGEDAGDMAAFGASDGACYHYPGADQQSERAAYCRGARWAARQNDASGTAIGLMRAYYAAEDARNDCPECDNAGPWDHCGACSVRIGGVINEQLLFLDSLSTAPSPSPVARVPDSAEIARIRADIINTPETADFMAGVPIEATHQRERWGVDHDAGKSPFDWFWLIGYLAQKAADAAVRGDVEKAKHHTISTGAALANWHANLSGAGTSMRPGIEPPSSSSETSADDVGGGR
jgi:hypothetical protein